MDGLDDGEVSALTEPRGTGVNKYSYFSTNDRIFHFTSLIPFDSAWQLGRPAFGKP